MPIGTSNTQVLLKVKKPPVRTSQQQQNHSIANTILAFIVIQIVAMILAPITGGASEGIALTWDLSDFSASVIAASVEFGVDFTINQVYDVLTKQNTTNTTLLNLLPIFGGIGKVTRGARATKVLKLAQETKILEQWGVNSIRNLHLLTTELNGQKILTNKFLWNFTNDLNKETLLANISQLASIELRKNFKTLAAKDITNILKLESTISKIHPSLVAKLKIHHEPYAQKFLNDLGTSINEVVTMSTEDYLAFITKLQETGKGGTLLLTLNQMRDRLIKFDFLKTTHQKYLLMKFSLKKINPKFYLRKMLNAKFEKIQQQITKIEKKIRAKIAKIEEKGKKLFHKFEKKALTEGAIIPLNSEVFLGYKLRAIGIKGDVALSIFYRNPKYKPITVITTLVKATEFALAASPFRYYMYQSGWSFGWGIKNNKIMKVISFLPNAVQQAIRDSYQTWLKISKTLKQVQRIETIIKEKKYTKPIFKFTETFAHLSLNAILGHQVVKWSKKLLIKGHSRCFTKSLARYGNKPKNKWAKKYHKKQSRRF